MIAATKQVFNGLKINKIENITEYLKHLVIK